MAQESAPGGKGDHPRSRGTRSSSNNSLLAGEQRVETGANAKDGACLPPSLLVCAGDDRGDEGGHLLREVEDLERSLVECHEVKQQRTAAPFARQMAAVRQYRLARQQHSLLARYAREESPAHHRDYYRSLGTYLHTDVEGRRKELRQMKAELERMRSGNEGDGTAGWDAGQCGSDSSDSFDDGASVRSQDDQRSLAGGEENEHDEKAGAAPSPSDKRAGYLLPSAFACAGRNDPGRAQDLLLRQIKGEEQAFLWLDAVKKRHAADPFVWQMATAKQCLMAQRQHALLERYAKGENEASHRDYYRSLGTLLQGDVESRRAELRRLRLRLEAASAEWEDVGARQGSGVRSSSRRRLGGSRDDGDSGWNNHDAEARSWDEGGSSVVEDSVGDEEEGLLDAFRLFARYTAEKTRAIRQNGRRGLWQVVME